MMMVTAQNGQTFQNGLILHSRLECGMTCVLFDPAVLSDASAACYSLGSVLDEVAPKMEKIAQTTNFLPYCSICVCWLYSLL